MQDAILKLDQPEKARLMNAVNEICTDNPEAVAQLEKIAKIKTGNPFIWKMLLAKLKNY